MPKFLMANEKSLHGTFLSVSADAYVYKVCNMDKRVLNLALFQNVLTNYFANLYKY